MKKIVLVFGVLVLCLGLVVAAQEGYMGGEDDEGEFTPRENNGNTQAHLSVGDYDLGDGIRVRIEAGEQNKVRIRTRDVEAHSELNITPETIQNRTRLQSRLSNGVNAEIKIMPDVAAEQATERLRIRNCTSEYNCSIELKEVGQGNGVRAAYEVRAEKEARIFGLFRTRMNVQTQVDSETGEIISAGKPWWAIFASED